MPDFSLQQLARLFKFFLISLVSLYSANCQKIDYSAVRVKEVIDGDTVILSNNQHVRYLGIDTPETRKKIDGRWIYDPMPYSEESKEFNRRLVEGRVVRLEFDIEKRDRYNRLLAYCFIGDTLVNAELLEEGLAVLYTSVPNIKYVDLFVKSQKQARENKKGLWQEAKIVQAEDAGVFLGRIETVEGRVKNSSVTDKAIFLKFGSGRKGNFTAVIFKNDLGLFDKDELVSNNFYKGKKLRITGLIRDYNGPEIIIRHPSQIENLN